MQQARPRTRVREVAPFWTQVPEKPFRDVIRGQYCARCVTGHGRRNGAGRRRYGGCPCARVPRFRTPRFIKRARLGAPLSQRSDASVYQAVSREGADRACLPPPPLCRVVWMDVVHPDNRDCCSSALPGSGASGPVAPFSASFARKLYSNCTHHTTTRVTAAYTKLRMYSLFHLILQGRG